MNDVSKKMKFEVATDLKNPTNLYSVEIDLEKEVDSYTREAAISLAGAVVRNNFKNVYGRIMNSQEMAEVIREKINSWLPIDYNLVNRVVLSPVKNKTKSA